MSEARESVLVPGAQVAAFRLRRHHLDAPAPRSRLPAVVGDTGGVQAQVMGMTRIALWARVDGLARDDVERALNPRRTLVRTWSLRGALHLHRTRDLMIVKRGLLASRLPREQQWVRRVGLDEEKTTPLVLAALEDGPLTREELADRLNRTVGETTKRWRDGGWGVKKAGSSLAWYLVQPAMVRGLACYGPSDGARVSFARVDRWVRELPEDPGQEAAEEELVRRYLRAFGPADAGDFRRWAGVSMRQAKDVLARLRDETVEVEAAGREGLLLRKDLSALEASEPDGDAVRLLPSFDPFLLGHADRGHLVDPGHYKAVYRDAGWLAPVVLRGGRVVGTWSYTRGPRALAVDVRTFGRADPRTRAAVRDLSQDLATFLGSREASVRFAR